MTSLLLVLHLRATGTSGNINIEAQAHNGLRLWLKHFKQVTLACLKVDHVNELELPLSTIEGADRLRFVGLPEAWLPHHFFAKLPSVSKQLGEEIDRCEHLQFAIGGLWGDWSSVAAIIATAKKRRFSVWTDHVESDTARAKAFSKRGISRLYTRATAALMAPYEKAIIRKSKLGLFHGADCYEAYSGYCGNPHLVHDIHIGSGQHISEHALRERLNSRAGRPLRIAYAGRAAPEKGPLDWVRAITQARQSVDVTGTWFGTGPDMSAAQSLAAELNAPVSFPGVLPHFQLLDTLQTFDAFAFCHKTLESPRCLIEALACGLPIIGYRSHYPEELLAKYPGGILVERNSIDGLAGAIASLADDRHLAALSVAARQSGAGFTDEAVFAHRADLIKSIAV